jgi:sortase A
MRDKRSVDELSIEELERILAIRKREARQVQLRRMKRAGRVVEAHEPPAPTGRPVPAPTEPETAPNGQGPDANGSSQKPDGHENGNPPVDTRSLPPVSAMPHFEDDVDEIDYTSERQTDHRAWKRFVNTTLLLVEVAAVAALIFIAANLLGAIDLLESETRQAQEMSNATRQAMIPTLEPTPTLQLNQVVLPSGHVFASDGAPRPNLDEIPSHLLPMVQAELFQPVIARPPRTPETALTLSIPNLNLDQTIVPGTDWEALKQGVGQVLNGANPGDDTGNVVLAAHNDIYGELFRDLDQLQPGDRFQIQTERRTYTYVITGWDIVDPTDVHVMENQGRPTATLISCYPYRVNDRRIVVFAERLDI